MLNGKSRFVIGRYEAGTQVPDRGLVIEWALACGVQYEWLAGSDFPPIQRRGGGSATSDIWYTNAA